VRAVLGIERGYAVRIGDLRLIACDTTIPGRDDGELDLAWLESELAREPETPTIVAMHHPPILTGIGGLDAIGLPAGTRLGLSRLLERSPQVRRVIAGHVHRGAFGVVGGCGVVACPSTNLQAKLEIGAAGFTIVREPPAFAVHALLDGELVSHLQPGLGGAQRDIAPHGMARWAGPPT
jgi:Icc protein